MIIPPAITLTALLALAISPANVFAQSSTSSLCPGEKGYYYTNDKSKRNPRKGGFVSHSANVGDYVYIAPSAAVCGSASVLKFARVYGNAIIRDEAEITDKARVYGNARVSGEAYVAGEAKVSGHAKVGGDAIVEGTVWIKGYTKITTGTHNKGRLSGVQSAKSKQADLKKRQGAQQAELEAIIRKIKIDDEVRYANKPIRKIDTFVELYSYQWGRQKTAALPCTIELFLSSYANWTLMEMVENFDEKKIGSFAPYQVRRKKVSIDISKTDAKEITAYREKSNSQARGTFVSLGKVKFDRSINVVVKTSSYDFISSYNAYKNQYCKR